MADPDVGSRKDARPTAARGGWRGPALLAAIPGMTRYWGSPAHDNPVSGWSDRMCTMAEGPWGHLRHTRGPVGVTARIPSGRRGHLRNGNGNGGRGAGSSRGLLRLELPERTAVGRSRSEHMATVDPRAQRGNAEREPRAVDGVRGTCGTGSHSSCGSESRRQRAWRSKGRAGYGTAQRSDGERQSSTGGDERGRWVGVLEPSHEQRSGV